MFNYFVIVHANNLSFLLLVIRGTRWVPHMEEELLTLPEHMSSHPVCSEVPVVRSLVSFIVFCTWLFVLVSCFFCSMYCLSSFDQCIVCPPSIYVYIYPFGIFKYFLSIYVSWYLTRGRHWNLQVDIVEQYPSIQCSHSSLYTN